MAFNCSAIPILALSCLEYDAGSFWSFSELTLRTVALPLIYCFDTVLEKLLEVVF